MENAGHEFAPLFAADRLRAGPVFRRWFDDGDELEEGSSQRFQKVIDRFGVFGIIVLHHGQDVVFNPMFFQGFKPLHDGSKRTAPGDVVTVAVM